MPALSWVIKSFFAEFTTHTPKNPLLPHLPNQKHQCEKVAMVASILPNYNDEKVWVGHSKTHWPSFWSNFENNSLNSSNISNFVVFWVSKALFGLKSTYYKDLTVYQVLKRSDLVYCVKGVFAYYSVYIFKNIDIFIKIFKNVPPSTFPKIRDFSPSPEKIKKWAFSKNKFSSELDSWGRSEDGWPVALWIQPFALLVYKELGVKCTSNSAMAKKSSDKIG